MLSSANLSKFGRPRPFRWSMDTEFLRRVWLVSAEE